MTNDYLSSLFYLINTYLQIQKVVATNQLRKGKASTGKQEKQPNQAKRDHIKTKPQAKLLDN